MKIAIIGGTGYIGSHILEEALKRGHHVVSFAKENKLKVKSDNLTENTFSIFEEEKFDKALKGVDLIISAYHPGYFHVDSFHRFQDAYKTIIKQAKKHKVKLIAIGSAVSLKESHTDNSVSEGFFNKAFLGMGRGMDEVLETFKKDSKLNWTMLLPPIEITAVDNDKSYRIGTEYLFVDEFGESRISARDLAKAIIDEVEEPKYENQSFTIGY